MFFYQARTEITITPVVNTPAQSHSNDLIQVVISSFSFHVNAFTFGSCVQVFLHIIYNLILKGRCGGRNDDN